ncbi:MULTISPECIES: AAA family ATPase [unclassified Tenacibaculum]|uniref:AAA family ATPase n=1 Tax=unclassified Tenacibaculum TaxID=2635139 RepID=UPI001F1931A6|nr:MULTISPECIES: AAA family ATPase [unclassified Tenacibaculum]MCF2873345.1 AAA family ATPase [Tenacibaculum sp. Cn5-1]MCF2933501.1 AAA family ATPase [Tenacibaculum sp. Cn5-34]MCG7509917.1 AAA family ATPase [Tenacibaculum sp. Cn5-46]
MRIKSLEIEGYKVFQNKQKFNFGKNRHLLIGINGSGKSTIIEAIALIFSNLKDYLEDKKEDTLDFIFTVEYSFEKKTILKETTTTKEETIEIKLIRFTNINGYYQYYDNDVEITNKKEIYSLLPDNLIFYYAGACFTLEEIIDKTEDLQANDLYQRTNVKEINKVIESITKNLIYVRKEYYPILFALNYINKEQVLPISKETFTIDNIRLEFQQYKFTANKDYSDLFRLTGFLRTYLNHILKETNGVEYNVETKTPYIDISYHNAIISSIEKLNISHDLKYNKSRFLVFHFFSLLYRIGFIKKLDITIRDSQGVVYSINDFSEGEQQLIVLDSIKNNICSDNTVLFLDEPDAYLHPQRQRELFPYLNEIYSKDYLQIITTTHSPFVAQSFDNDEILLLNEKGDKIEIGEGLISNSAITKEIFRINSDYKIEIEKLLNEFKNLVKKIILKEKNVDDNFFKLRTKLNQFGESLRFITSFETRKIISKGIEVNEEN